MDQETGEEMENKSSREIVQSSIWDKGILASNLWEKKGE